MVQNVGNHRIDAITQNNNSVMTVVTISREDLQQNISQIWGVDKIGILHISKLLYLPEIPSLVAEISINKYDWGSNSKSHQRYGVLSQNLQAPTCITNSEKHL
jgi:hypothetical protein